MDMSIANRQWATRPDDERFVSLPDLYEHASTIKRRSQQGVVSTRVLTFHDDNGTFKIAGPTGDILAEPTNQSFAQLAKFVGAPSGFLSTLPTPILRDAMSFKFQEADAEDVGILLTRDADTMEETREVTLRAMTGDKYGRIWNADVIRALIDYFGDGVSGDWTVPGEFGKPLSQVTKANTTLYASDRDMFVFLTDEKNRIEQPNRRDGKSGELSRGLIFVNSETGDKALKVYAFLFDYVCMNRNIWGLEELAEVSLRHTSGAPSRWLGDMKPKIIEYRQGSAMPLLQLIAAAQLVRIDDSHKFITDKLSPAYKSRKFAQSVIDAHWADEGRPIETLYDMSNALTARARQITHTDARVALERESGRVIRMAA